MTMTMAMSDIELTISAPLARTDEEDWLDDLDLSSGPQSGEMLVNGNCRDDERTTGRLQSTSTRNFTLNEDQRIRDTNQLIELLNNNSHQTETTSTTTVVAQNQIVSPELDPNGNSNTLIPLNGAYTHSESSTVVSTGD